MSALRDDTLSFDRYAVIEDDEPVKPVDATCWVHYVDRDEWGNCPDCIADLRSVLGMSA